MVGQTVTLTTTSGQILEGVFHTFSPFTTLSKEMRNVYVIKACRVIKSGDNKGGSDGTTKDVEEGSTVVIPSYKVASVQVKSMRLDAPNAAEKTAAAAAANAEDAAFQTDSQISGGKGGNQSLVAAGSAWTSAGDGSGAAAAGIGGSLDGPSATPSAGRFGVATTAAASSKGGADALNWRAAATKPNEIKSAPPSGPAGPEGGKLGGSIGDWDQFSANEKKFNVKASFDENLYTTKLDVTNIDRQKRAEAERIAKEIEGTVSSNIHVAEERGQKIMTDYDEEDLYSGVLTKELKAREVPAAAADGAGQKDKKKVASGGKVMNYAAAAAAAKKEATTAKAAAAAVSKDAKASSSAPDLSQVKSSSEEKKVEEKEASPTESSSENKTASADKKEDADGDAKKEDEKKKTTTTKLNPKAKTFEFNPAAKTFTPSFTPAAAAPPVQQQQMDPMQQQQQQGIGQQQHHGMPGEYNPGMMGGMGPPPPGGGGPQFAPMPVCWKEFCLSPLMNPGVK
ncbi:hypothetical protein ACHAXR_005859 [Thalassiosira sp. AJA248-18]